MEPSEEEIRRAVHALLDGNRLRCLWWARPDYYLTTPEEQLSMLRYIEQHGDLAAFRRARVLRGCLSWRSSENCAGYSPSTGKPRQHPRREALPPAPLKQAASRRAKLLARQ